MTHHPHVHMIVTGGGISPDGLRWIASRPDYLVPVEDTSPALEQPNLFPPRSALRPMHQSLRRWPDPEWRAPCDPGCGAGIGTDHQLYYNTARLRRQGGRVMVNLSTDFAADAQVSNWHDPEGPRRRNVFDSYVGYNCRGYEAPATRKMILPSVSFSHGQCAISLPNHQTT